MGLWHVIDKDWRTQCCGTPPTVDDEVSRPLPSQDPAPESQSLPSADLAGLPEGLSAVTVWRGRRRG
ncbi:DUF6578 domain-containing protein [Streptomyces sp. XY006]|uniref:DUF6578 domain-containing protein n=1 Tax=Streptomyces sp. XY006 TaxID=2021410 RepID=UPI000B8C33F3|nr:DUF6578 domain-containing protein [Streptomyces sp. XY006]OXS31044.1 hypothetical protein CHR28_33565 [Streptomyces sp. XY006]